MTVSNGGRFCIYMTMFRTMLNIVSIRREDIYYAQLLTHIGFNGNQFNHNMLNIDNLGKVANKIVACHGKYWFLWQIICCP